MQTKDDFLKAYHQMVMIRRLEEKAAELYQQGKIGGFLHLYIGQEAVAAGISAALTEKDHVITAYRDHGVAIAQGMDPGVLLAELLGKQTGASHGKGGSMHLADTSLNFWGGHAIVGAHLPLAAGIATSFQYLKNDNVIVCMFGDGATNIGYFHEALNLSQVWNLPVVWLCENNQYGMGTAVSRASAVAEIRQKAEGYCMPNERVDGMEVLAVYEAVQRALQHARAEGPYFVEALTYRYRGHSMGDPERYREADEIKRWQDDDPIGRFRAVIKARELSDDSELDSIDARVDDELAAAVEFAEQSPDPPPEALYEDVYAPTA
ncbi:MAG: pyruvate dehydrogenase (acetyl-transferring) E1 component subunit alpha [Anaerolineales bacterium]